MRNNIEIMEKSSTCMSKAHSSSPKEEEESGWTFYFEDFFCNTTAAANDNIDQQHPSSNSFSKPSPSQVPSDATNCSPKKLMTDSNDHRSISSINYKKLGSFKKRRSSTSNYKAAAALLVDDALEDTATSPANSPKQKGTATTSVEQTVDEKMTELKKRGLCLVPIFTFANYLGYN